MSEFWGLPSDDEGLEVAVSSQGGGSSSSAGMKVHTALPCVASKRKLSEGGRQREKISKMDSDQLRKTDQSNSDISFQYLVKSKSESQRDHGDCCLSCRLQFAAQMGGTSEKKQRFT